MTPVATDPPPFQPFYAAHRAGVVRLLVGMVGPDAAQDCFQETWLKVLRAWPPADPGGRLDSWVLTIAHRTALDVLRREGREHPVEQVPEPRIEREDEFAVLEPGPLWDAVRSLAPKQRAAVVLHTVLDRSHAQVAEVLDCSEDAARRSYADGIAALRRTMEVER